AGCGGFHLSSDIGHAWEPVFSPDHVEAPASSIEYPSNQYRVPTNRPLPRRRTRDLTEEFVLFRIWVRSENVIVTSALTPSRTFLIATATSTEYGFSVFPFGGSTCTLRSAATAFGLNFVGTSVLDFGSM